MSSLNHVLVNMEEGGYRPEQELVIRIQEGYDEGPIKCNNSGICMVVISLTILVIILSENFG
jgi:hypothetical protein